MNFSRRDMRRPGMEVRRPLLGLSIAILAVACGGGGGGSSGPTLTAITVTPASPFIVTGTSRQFSAAGSYSDGSTRDLTASAVWSSQYTAVLSVGAAGLMNGLTTGSSQVTATADGVSGHTLATVVLPGTHWTLTQAGSMGFAAVAWGASKFVALTVSGDIYTSPDGSSWTKRSSGSFPTWYGIGYGGGLFVAVGQGAIATSPDGISWTSRVSPTTGPILGVSVGGTQDVAVGAGSPLYNPAFALTSPDSVTWTSRNPGVTGALRSVVWFGTGFAAVGTSGAILTSPDGVTWTKQTSNTVQDLYGIAWDGTNLVAVGTDVIVSSRDGVNWTTRFNTANYQFNAVASSGTLFVAVGGSGSFGTIIFTSPDGTSWTAQTPPPPSNGGGGYGAMSGVAWSGAQFVAVGGAGIVLTSP